LRRRAVRGHRRGPAAGRRPPRTDGRVRRTLSERIDVALLDAVADRGHQLLLVGDRQATCDPRRLRSLLERPNVRWVGARPFAALPGYLRAMHVGLVPYADTAFNRASFPLKTLEYLAAGRSVVATDLPSLRWLGSEHVRVADTPAQFADAVDAAIREPLSPAPVAARRAFARQHSWSRRGDRLAVALGLPPADAPRQLVAAAGEIA
jgi:teichuronic acid biosynthesis glycosyltransferase TuaH